MPYKNPEKARENRRKYRAANREKIRESQRRYRAGNPEKARAQYRHSARKWREAHPDLVIDQNQRKIVVGGMYLGYAPKLEEFKQRIQEAEKNGKE